MFVEYSVAGDPVVVNLICFRQWVQLGVLLWELAVGVSFTYTLVAGICKCFGVGMKADARLLE